MKPPEATPKTVRKEVMLPCWDILPKQRPTFQDIVIKLKAKLSKKYRATETLIVQSLLVQLTVAVDMTGCVHACNKYIAIASTVISSI